MSAKSISKILSRKYRKITKNAHKIYQNLSKEDKEKKKTVIASITKISQKMKNKSLLSIEKNTEQDNYRTSSYNCKKVF